MDIRKQILSAKGLKEEPRKFILVTNDWSGLGFAIQEIQKNGTEVLLAYKPKDDIDEDKIDQYEIQGDGITKSFPLDDLFAIRKKYRDYYWIFDGNHNVEIGEVLHKEGFKVWGGTQLQYDLENDREFGLKFAESCGLHSPEYQEFSSPEEGIAFLEQNEDKAYVVKPNGAEDSSLTEPFFHTPEAKNANLEARGYIKALNFNDYILQERKKGIEVNVELFMSKGKPVLAQVNLECKMKEDGDTGIPMGCAHDVCWVVPIESNIIQMTVAKFVDKLPDYTGFCDANVILGDDEVWFLEFCFRCGYNAHPNFFSTISEKTFLQTAADMIDGLPVKAYDGFGASVSLHCDSEHKGLTIYVPESIRDNFYLFDGYKDDDTDDEHFLMGGYGQEVAIVTARNYTIETAFHDAIENAWKIKFKGRGFRKDGDKRGYHTSIMSRYDALIAKHLI